MAAVVLLAAPASGGGDGPVPPAPGSFDLGVSTRSFDAPLFGSQLSTSYRLFTSQALVGGSNLQLWLHGGFPDYTTTVGLRGEGFQAGRFSVGFDAGDLQLGAIPSDREAGPLGDSYPLRGINLTARAGRSTWRVFGGGSRYDLVLPGGSATDTRVIGSDWLGNFGTFTLGAGVSSVRAPVPGSADTETLVLSGRFERAVLPRATLFNEAFLTDASALGYRLGLRWTLFDAELSTALYGFDEDLPALYPLFRPGEQGIEVRGRWRPTQLASLFGSVYYARDDVVRSRSELRGSIGAGIGFGSNRPHVSFHYSHDEVTYELLSAEGRIADRVSVGVSQRGAFGNLEVQAEHAFNGLGTELDRSQLYAVYRGVAGLRSFVHGSLLAQRDEGSNVGITVDGAIERPWRGPYYWLAGLGVAWVDRGSTTGEGLIRAGVSRRMADTGWYLRFEATAPVSIGLERSDLGRNTVALDLGNRFEWSDLRDLGSRLPGTGRRQPSGGVEGVVRDAAGGGLPGIPVLVNGRPLATTDREGRFRVRDLPVGTAGVTLDLRAVEPGYEIDGAALRELPVEEGRMAWTEFGIGRFTAIQGTVVRCEGERLAAVVDADVGLASATGPRAIARTSATGSFHFDRLTPGSYTLTVDATDGGPTSVEVDLADDIFGYVLRVGCGGE